MAEHVGDFYNQVMAHEVIYSLLYSPYRTERPIKDQIVHIETSKLKWANDWESFIFIWGWPGPDFNVYKQSTYGKGWAFTKEEIIKAWGEE